MAAGKLIVHIGPAKTGTSAIQHVLAAHDNSIVIYPKTGLWWDGAHHNLTFNFYPGYRRPDAETADITELFRRIGAEVGDSNRNIIISSEALWGQDVGTFIRALLPHLGPEKREVEILAACREHFALAASIYNQRVKDAYFNECRTPGEFLAQMAGVMTYAQTLDKLERGEFPVRVLNYHPAGDFVSRFLTHVGFPPEAIPPVEARNISLSVKGMVAMLAVNRAAAPEERAACLAALEHMPGFFARPHGIFDATAIAAADAVFRRDRTFLEQAYKIALPEPVGTESEGGFCVTPKEWDDIAAATAALGETGNAVTNMARQFLKC